MRSTDSRGAEAVPVPSAFPAMWRALRRGFEAEPLWISIAFGLALLAALPDALIALWLKELADGATSGSRGVVLAACVGLGVSAAATWFLALLSTRTQRRFRDRVLIALESHVARLQATLASIEHHERPEYLDRLSVLRNQVFVLDHMYMSLFSTCGWLLRLGVTLALLATVHPVLVFLAVFALPTVLFSSWRPGVERAAEERGASADRLGRHLFDLATTAPPGKEVRVTRIGERLLRERRAAWQRWFGPVAAARRQTALWQALGWLIFSSAYVGAIAFVCYGLGAPVASLVLVLSAGARLSGYIGATVGEIGFLRGIWMDGSKRMAWLEDYAASLVQDAEAPAPLRFTSGIRFEKVSFRYPATERLVLEDVDLELAPGSVVAIVGENGAGKTTLVKLLCQLYQPTRGRILVDGVDLARISPEDWRGRLAGAFQDFFRFEFRARHTVGLGDVPRLDDAPGVKAAVDRAGAKDVIERLVAGLETQLGPSWPEGVDLSFGQWQKLALARGFMRERPLLLVLDEPTAALDAETEHALFERYAAASRERTHDGRITLLVSHRFSTVRMADQIVVMNGARVVEVGSHEALLERRGQYAELYGIQAAAYR
jgi:ATP-binding cassette, subfamily B, bacterial